MEKRKNGKYKICGNCNLTCPFPKKLFNLFKNPFKNPYRDKCKKIKDMEKDFYEKKTLEKAAKCKNCGMECEKPLLKGGKGGENCKKISNNEKSFIKEALASWMQVR